MRPPRSFASFGGVLIPGSPIPKEAEMSLPKVTVLLSMLTFAAVLPAQTAETHTTSANASKVRIVRLSEVKGDVQMDRNIGRGMETGIANLPIVEQTRLQTAAGAAEVEFEDNSTMRIGPNSIVEFPKLERLPNGATVSWARVARGTAYVSLMKSSQPNEFALLVGAQTVLLPPSSHIRLEMGSGDARLAVLDGSLKLQGSTGEIDVAKKKTVTFNLATAGELSVDNHVASEPLDSWDKASVEYHQRLAMVSSLNSSPYAYGMSDLNYYGSFMDASSCGMSGAMMWRPYFASAGWDPYANGSWAWYGTAGYSWVSPYPWGWTPYHSGSWSFCPGMGWGWMPGSSWMGLNNVAMLPPQSTHGGGGRPILPIKPPASGAVTVIPVSTRPLVRSELKSGDWFEFRKDSAGMGIPRDTLGKLDKLSQHANTHGSAEMPVYVTAPETGGVNGRAGASSGAVPITTIHRGSPSPGMGEPGQPSFGSVGAGSGSAGGGMPSRAPSAPSAPAGGPSAPSGHPR
jgi:hypothetical protein